MMCCHGAKIFAAAAAVVGKSKGAVVGTGTEETISFFLLDPFLSATTREVIENRTSILWGRDQEYS